MAPRSSPQWGQTRRPRKRGVVRRCRGGLVRASPHLEKLRSSEHRIANRKRDAVEKQQGTREHSDVFRWRWLPLMVATTKIPFRTGRAVSPRSLGRTTSAVTVQAPPMRRAALEHTRVHRRQLELCHGERPQNGSSNFASRFGWSANLCPSQSRRCGAGRWASTARSRSCRRRGPDPAWRCPMEGTAWAHASCVRNGVLDERTLDLGDERDCTPAGSGLRAANEHAPAAKVDVPSLGSKTAPHSAEVATMNATAAARACVSAPSSLRSSSELFIALG